MKTYKSKEIVAEFSKGIIPAMKFDASADFDGWREKASAKLKELLGLPLTICDDEFKITLIEENEEFKKIKFEFQSEKGYFIECEMLF